MICVILTHFFFPTVLILDDVLPSMKVVAR